LQAKEPPVEAWIDPARGGLCRRSAAKSLVSIKEPHKAFL
jgi:hypothetical protein